MHYSTGQILVFPANQQRLWRIPERPASATDGGICADTGGLHPTSEHLRLYRPIQSSSARPVFHRPSGSQSPIFNIQLPPENFFGLTESQAAELALSPSAEQGYYLFLEPLALGSHTIAGPLPDARPLRRRISRTTSLYVQ
jgi:hypothetical protein